jgi:uncharacterized membrane protein
MRPELDLKDKISETMSALFLFTNAALLVLTLPSLPETIPIHFNSAGETDGYGSKYITWIIFSISLSIYVGLTLLSMFPRLYNNRITERNREEQYRMTGKMIRTLKAMILCFFALTTFFILQNAQFKMMEYSKYLILILFLLIFPVTIYYLIKLGRIR